MIFSILMSSAGDIGFAHAEQDLMAASIAGY
jgi:hypothetical protein